MSEANLQLRLSVARDAVEAVGGALLAMRGRSLQERAGDGGQLKTVVDAAAEAWVLASLRHVFGREVVLAEEQQQGGDARWQARSEYWTVDAVDGTRSYADGFDGFCVQAAWVQNGVPVVGVLSCATARRATTCSACASRSRTGRSRRPAGGSSRTSPASTCSVCTAARTGPCA